MNPWTGTAEGLRITIRVTPKASKTAITGTTPLPDGRTALAVRLAAPPVDGAANAELIAFMAKALDAPKSAVTLLTGQTARVKTLLIVGDSQSTAERLRNLV